MPRRSKPALLALFASRRSRPTSTADGPGCLYAFSDTAHKWKVGMTSNFARRKRQWDRQCPCPSRRWKDPIAVPRRRRAESLAHLLLELKCDDRPRNYCSHCRKIHCEVFTFTTNRSFTWKRVIRPLLAIAARA
ncbi:hypothetical protein FB446DRAFT_795959 [Lentinula raphanica]|nr:hypothetical protein FB446DRAFT_795959 [Lentinula raphanica]